MEIVRNGEFLGLIVQEAFFVALDCQVLEVDVNFHLEERIGGVKF